MVQQHKGAVIIGQCTQDPANDMAGPCKGMGNRQGKPATDMFAHDDIGQIEPRHNDARTFFQLGQRMQEFRKVVAPEP